MFLERDSQVVILLLFGNDADEKDERRDHRRRGRKYWLVIEKRMATKVDVPFAR
jgi:hypothetical protein